MQASKLILDLFRARKNHANHMEKIPLEVFQEILLYVSPSDIKNILENMDDWREKLLSNLFWKRKCHAENYEAVAKPFLTEDYRQFLANFSIEWHGIFAYNLALQENWEKAICETVPIETNIAFNKVHHFDDQTLVVSTLCSNILFIDYAAKRTAKIFNFDRRPILQLLKCETILIVVSYNNYLMVWDIETEVVLTKLQLNPTDKMLAACESAIAFGNASLSYVLKLTKDQSVPYDTSGATCGCFHENLLFLGLENGTIEVIDFTKNSIFGKLNIFTEKKVKRLLVKNTFMVIFSEDTDVVVWNLHTDSILRQFNTGVRLDFELFEKVIFIGQNKMILLGADESTTQVWNYLTGTILFVINNGYTITFIASNRHHIFTGSSEENLIKMWCNKTGRLVKKLNFQNYYSGAGQFLVTDTKAVLVQPCYSASKKLYVLDYSKDVKVKKCVSKSFSDHNDISVWKTQTDFQVFKSYTYEMVLESNWFEIVQLITNLM